MTIGEKRPGVRVPYLDLSVKDSAHRSELVNAVEKVLTHGRVLMGPEHDELERRLAQACRKRYAAAVGSGTEALYLALRSLDLGPGDEVITTPLSWIATVNAIALCGATPIFVDVGEDLNIDPDRIEEAITPRTKVVLPVHFSGTLCDMGKIMAIAARHDIAVVEDAAQAFGAHLEGRPAGSFGLINTFSMNPMKVFCAYGEAGAVVTDAADLHEKIVSLRYNGTKNREECIYPGLNSRLDTVQAAMLLVNLGRLHDRIESRRRIASAYSRLLSGVVRCPVEQEGYFNVYYTYTIVTDHRDGLREHLSARGIETKVHHPILMPHQPAYRHLPASGIPVAERLVGCILSIPNHQDMDSDTVEYVADTVKGYFDGI